MLATQEIKLDEPTTAATARHEVTLSFVIAQDGAPFVDSVTKYANASDAVVLFITGSIVSMSGALGYKGNKPKNGPFDVTMRVDVDGQRKASGAWEGLSREYALLFEKQVLEVWLDMNKQAVIAAKAQGKI